MNSVSLRLWVSGLRSLPSWSSVSRWRLRRFSLALGLVLGLGVQHYFATHGLDLRWFFKSSLPTALVFDPIIYARLSLTRIASSVWIVFLTATVISFYPALKAARTKLPDALKVF